VEFIGIDNNSSDRTGEIFIRAGVKSFFESRQSSGYARLCGLEHAVGRYYIGIDADTMYPPYYIQTVIEKLQRPGIVAVSSLWSFIPDKKRPAASLAFYEFLRDIHLRMLFIRRPELVVRGMVFSYVIAAGRKTGYRVDLLRGGDDGIMALGLKKDGKIKLLTCRKTRVTTSSGTLSADGSLWKSFLVRFSKVLSGFGKYFTKRSHYEDDESNMINKKDGNI
jgi:glycosyltransferase involved in cell wall biosynthesis